MTQRSRGEEGAAAVSEKWLKADGLLRVLEQYPVDTHWKVVGVGPSEVGGCLDTASEQSGWVTNRCLISRRT